MIFYPYTSTGTGILRKKKKKTGIASDGVMAGVFNPSARGPGCLLMLG